MATPLDEATELLQTMIRNTCVNDGSPDSGHETRTVETLAAYLAGPGVEMQRYEPHPGRGSLVLRVEGSDAKAPSLHLMGHIDVVPVNPSGWKRDPFGGELVDGEIWGRGALDMLSITATMAVVTKQLLRAGFRPKGTLIFSGMADEEALGTWGAEWLTEHAWDDVKADYVITESGEPPLPVPTLGGPKALLTSGEKGSHWIGLKVKGTPGHGSIPYRTDNALVKAGEIARRVATYRPPLHLDGQWQAFVERMQFKPELSAGLLSTERWQATLDSLPLGIARIFDAFVHTTFSPNILQSGVKTNIVPDSASLTLDIRTMPGDEGPEVRALLKDAIGDLWDQVEITDEGDNPATASALDTPLWKVLERVTGKLIPGVGIVPAMMVGATDARFFRRKGVVAYGYSLYSEKLSFAEYVTMFHGHNERIDQDSLGLMLQLWDATAREFLS